MKKIRLLWLVNDYYINNFMPIYEKCKNSQHFEIIIVSTDYLLDGEYYRTSKKIYDHLMKNKIKCHNSRKNSTEEYIDLETFKPDYIFVLTPYEMYLPKVYSFKKLASIARLCSISYGTRIVDDKGDYKNFIKGNNYFEYSWKTFIEAKEIIDDFTEEEKLHFEVIGNVKLETHGKKLVEKNQENKNFTIAWKPRWTLEENDSSFKRYISDFYKYFKENSNFMLLLYVHPLLYNRLAKLDKNEKYPKDLAMLKKLKNVQVIEDYDFLEKIFAADVFVTDHSSTLAEFTATGKPIIYCETGVKLNKLGQKIVENSYVANNVDEAKALIDLLSKKNDPMLEKRMKSRNNYFYIKEKSTKPSDLFLAFIEKDYKANKIIVKQIEKYVDEINTLVKEVAYLKQENKELQTKYFEIISSNSWKITKPLRIFKTKTIKKR